MKWIVRGVLLIVVLGFVVVAGAGTLLMTFNPNDHKAKIIAAVKDATGRDMAINGDIGVMFFPVLGFKAAEVTLGNPSGFNEKDFISVGALQAGIRIMPLLDKKVELTKVILDKPSITIIKTASGKSNLDFKKSSGDRTATTTTSDGTTMNFNIEGIEITNATVITIDHASGKTTKINPLNLSLPGFAPGQETSIAMDMVMQSGKPETTMKVKANGRLKADPQGGIFSLSGLKADLGIQPAGAPEEFKLNISGDAAIDSKAEKIAITNLKADGKGTTMTGSATVTGFAKPDIAFDITSPSVDLSALMPAKKPGAAKDDTKPLMPVDVLRNLSLNGTIKIATLKAAGLTMDSVSAKIAGSQGVLNINPATFDFYEGKFQSAIKIDARSNPAMSLIGSVKNMQVAGLLKDKMGADYLSGLSNVSFDLNGTGNTMRALNTSAGGNITFRFSDGYINKWQLSKRINQAIDYFESGTINENASDKIYFTSLDGVFKGSGGVFTNDNLTLIAPKSHALGNGSVSTRDQNVNYSIRVGPGDKPEDFSKKKHLPIRITGPLSAPQYTLDLQALVMEAAGEKIEEKKEELLNKAFEKLGGKKKAAEPVVESTTPAASDPAAPAATAVPAPEPEPEPAEDPAQQLLKGLLGGN